MNIGHLLAGLGVLGVILGIGMYAAAWHKTIGIGGVGVGVVLILLGMWLARSNRVKATPQTPPPQS